LRWLIDQREIDQAYRLAAALWRFWFLRGHLTEGRAWLGELLAQSDVSVTASARAMVIYAAGQLAMIQNDLAVAASLAGESLTLWRSLDRPREEAYSLLVLGSIAQRGGDPTRARDLFEQARATSLVGSNPEVEALSNYYLGELAHGEGDNAGAQLAAWRAIEISRAIQHRAVTSLALCLLGVVSHEQGDDGAALTLIEEGVAESRRVGAWWTSLTLARQAPVLAARGEQRQAWTAAAESLELSRRLGDRLGIAHALEAFAHVAAYQSGSERVLWLAAAALRLREEMNAPRSRQEEHALAPLIAHARTAVGDKAATDLETRGHAMSLDETVSSAMDASHLPQRRWSSIPSVELTPRERDVLRLLARGRSNRQIADELVLGERTVEFHVTNILGKLGLRSRAGAAIWAVEQKTRTTSP
jgi:DNA-binding CsgD family transcriptional regulator